LKKKISFFYNNNKTVVTFFLFLLFSFHNIEQNISPWLCHCRKDGKEKNYSFFMSIKKMAVTFVTGNKNKLAEVQAILGDVLPNLKSQALDCTY